MGDLGGPTRGKARDAPDEIRLARKPLRKGLSHLFSVGRRVNTFYNDGLLKAVDRPKNLLVEVLEGPGSSRSRKEWWRFPSFSIWEGYSAEGTGPLASSERSLAVTSTTGCPSESGLLPGWHPKPKSKSSTAGNICQMALAGREEVQVHVTVPLAPPRVRGGFAPPSSGSRLVKAGNARILRPSSPKGPAARGLLPVARARR